MGKTKVGSIIFLEHNEISPADLIILDTSEIIEKEAICLIDCQFISGRRELQKKKSSVLTHSNIKYLKNPSKFKLSCKLEYSQPNPKIDSFVGYLKLLNDPTLEKLTIDNFIPRGALIKKVERVMAMVVYIGNDTKLMRNCKLNFHKISFIEKLGQVYFLVFLCIVIIFSFVSH